MARTTIVTIHPGSVISHLLRGGLQALETLGRLLHVGREISHLLDLADLDRPVVRRRAAPRPLDRFFLRADLDHPVAAEHFLGLGEWAVRDLGLAAFEAHAR